jgi:hypothetical protein
MLLIQQRKSAGTSLVYTLSDILNKIIDNDVSISTINSRGAKLQDYLSKFQSVKSPIKSTHLHPTYDNFNWILRDRIKCVILLRNPEDSYQALKRHRELNNTFIEPNYALYNKNSKNILEEFYRNWSSLCLVEHILIVYFEELVKTPNSVINRILSFYEIEPTNSRIILQKKRFSGMGIKNLGIAVETNIMKGERVSFLYNPDFKSKLDSFFKKIKIIILSKLLTLWYNCHYLFNHIIK